MLMLLLIWSSSVVIFTLVLMGAHLVAYRNTRHAGIRGFWKRKAGTVLFYAAHWGKVQPPGIILAFQRTAREIHRLLPSAERETALRKLLESWDATRRAHIIDMDDD